MDVYSELDTFT